jgi:site-specific recombinase XerD
MGEPLTRARAARLAAEICRCGFRNDNRADRFDYLRTKNRIVETPVSRVKLALEDPAHRFASNLFHRAMLMTIYSTGMRRPEMCNFKVEDIDSDRMLIHIRQGKALS